MSRRRASFLGRRAADIAAIVLAALGLPACASSSFTSDAREVRDVLAARAPAAALAGLEAGERWNDAEAVKVRVCSGAARGGG